MASVTASDLQNIINTEPGGVIVVDVRTNSDFLKRSIAGAANIPFERIQTDGKEAIRQIIADQKNIYHDQIPTKIILYCNGGGKSKQAQNILADSGMADVAYLEGGLKQWLTVNSF
jgi:rhodanese-related sulfurtransferase